MQPALAFAKPPAGLDVRAVGRGVIIEIAKKAPARADESGSLGRVVAALLTALMELGAALCGMPERYAFLLLGLATMIGVGLIVWAIYERFKAPETGLTLRVSAETLQLIERKDGQIVRHERLEGRELLGVSVCEGPALTVRSTSRPNLQIPLDDKTFSEASWLARAINACCLARS